MPSVASLDNQRKRRIGESQCEVKSCEQLVYLIIEESSGRKHLSCYGHINELALKYMGESDCLVIIP